MRLFYFIRSVPQTDDSKGNQHVMERALEKCSKLSLPIKNKNFNPSVVSPC